MKNAIYILLSVLVFSSIIGADDSLDLAKIKKDVSTGFSNGGWNYDRYENLEPLKAGAKITIADIKGPAVIRHIHTTRHKKQFTLTNEGEELLARGVVLEIWFDDANEPAVMSPLADFFGDGCNGEAMYFSTPLIEAAPWSYNCYFIMPFKKRAKVILRNDTDMDTMNYSYVEWETLPRWDKSLGYFHATYDRKCFQLTPKSDETFFEIDGTGQIIGRQYSIVTDEPLFEKFFYVMEGNNEIDIDGKQRAIDYLGTEDSFTFSWGFQDVFIGLRAGMPLVEREGLKRLSIYRFHDHMPIRFNKSLRWHINWQHEKLFIERPERAVPWEQALDSGGGWVDYATVYYWYQNVPDGFKHKPLPPVYERQKTLLKSSFKTIILHEIM